MSISLIIKDLLQGCFHQGQASRCRASCHQMWQQATALRIMMIVSMDLAEAGSEVASKQSEARLLLLRL